MIFTRVTILVFFLIPPQKKAFTQEKKIIQIQGVFRNLPDSINFLLIKTNVAGRADTVGETISKDGKFSFSEKAFLNGQMYFIRFNSPQHTPHPTKRNWIRFILDTTSISLAGDFMHWPSIQIRASKALLVYENFYRIRDEIVSRSRSNSSSIWMEDSLKKTENKKITAFLIDYCKKNIHSVALPSIILNSQLNIDKKEELYGLFPDNVKNSFGGNKLKDYIVNTKLRAQIEIGNSIPNFVVEEKGGNQIAIHEIAKKYNYTLIDFWAYWCIPCREDVPDMKKAYSTFHDRGFNIVSISIDPNYMAWAKALVELNTKWNNAIDRTQKVKRLFSLKAIPAYILIDKDAKIVAMEIFGLNQLNKEYISNEGNTPLKLRKDGLIISMNKLFSSSK